MDVFRRWRSGFFSCVASWFFVFLYVVPVLGPGVDGVEAVSPVVFP